MSDILNDGKPGFVAEKPELCFAFYRLIQPGKTYYLMTGLAILCDIQIVATDSMCVYLT